LENIGNICLNKINSKKNKIGRIGFFNVNLKKINFKNLENFTTYQIENKNT